MLKDTLINDLKVAMQEKDNVKKAAVQMVRAAILNYEKDNKEDATDEIIIEIISKELKKRRDSLSEYEKSSRSDLIEDLKREIDILLAYLPEQLTTDELKNIVEDAIKEAEATSIKDMGKIMGLVIPKIKGRADSKAANEIIKSILS